MIDVLPDRPRKGRGAVGNPTGRYEKEVRAATDDGWGNRWWEHDGGGHEGAAQALATTLSADTSRSVITRNTSPDIPFNQSINPYRGCEHGCIYCFARPSHSWLGLSPGLDFETRLWAKFDAPRLLQGELANPKYRCQILALGTNSDCYQPVERQHRLTRRILEVLEAANHPVAMVTKSALVLRDVDILGAMARRNLVQVYVSVTTLDTTLARRMEPRAAAPGRRLKTIEGLARAGIPTGIMAAPMIPALNDAELDNILAAGARAGATSAGYILLRLPHELKDLFSQWLATHYPDKADHVLSLVRQSRGGRLNDPAFGSRMVGTGSYATMLAQRFKAACRRLDLNMREGGMLDASKFRPPPLPGEQLKLL